MLGEVPAEAGVSWGGACLCEWGPSGLEVGGPVGTAEECGKMNQLEGSRVGGNARQVWPAEGRESGSLQR